MAKIKEIQQITRFKMAVISRHHHAIKNPFHSTYMPMPLPRFPRRFPQIHLDRSEMPDRPCDHRAIFPFCTRQRPVFNTFPTAHRVGIALECSFQRQTPLFNAVHGRTDTRFLPSFPFHKRFPLTLRGNGTDFKKRPFLPILIMPLSR